MSRRKARHNQARPVLSMFSSLERREREWARQHGADLGRIDDQERATEVRELRLRAEQAMQEFKRTLSARALKSVGEYRSKRAEVRAHMKRTGRPQADAVRHVPVTPEKEREALRLLASRSKSHPPFGSQTVAADEECVHGARPLPQALVRKQDDAVARSAIPADDREACKSARRERSCVTPMRTLRSKPPARC